MLSTEELFIRTECMKIAKDIIESEKSQWTYIISGNEFRVEPSLECFERIFKQVLKIMTNAQ
jgi:hypothetical protein